MSKFLSLGVVATTPLVGISTWYWLKNRYNNRPNPDQSIILVSEDKGNFTGSCAQYDNGAIGGGHQQNFGGSEELLRYLFPNIDTAPPNNVLISIPTEVMKSKGWRILSPQQQGQPITFQRDERPQGEIPKAFKDYWEMWISDWTRRPLGVKKVVYTGTRFDADQQRQSRHNIDKLHKCYKGITWHSLQFNVDSQRLGAQRN